MACAARIESTNSEYQQVIETAHQKPFAQRPCCLQAETLGLPACGL